MKFSIRGFKNPTTTNPFVFSMRITKIIAGNSYDVDRYTFKPMAVVESNEVLKIETLS